MSCLVIDIQKNALDPDCSVSILLRRSYATAVKLNSTQISRWIKNELNGYDIKIEPKEIPNYRKYKSILQGHNLHYGWQNIIIPDRELENTILQQTNYQSIPELETFIFGNNNRGTGFLELNMAGHQVDTIHKLIRATPPIRNFIPLAFIEKILSSVRQSILDWALTLEKSGIKGENMIFSDDEKKLAQQHVTIINQHQGIAGNFINSNVSQCIQTPFIKENIQGLVEFLTENINLDEVDIESLKVAIDKDPKALAENQGFGAHVSKWFSDIIAKTASGVLSGNVSFVSQKIIEALNHFYFG